MIEREDLMKLEKQRTVMKHLKGKFSNEEKVESGEKTSV